MIRNPFTNRYIKVNGPTYKRIKREIQNEFPGVTRKRNQRGGVKSKAFEKFAKKMQDRFEQKESGQVAPRQSLSEEVLPDQKLTKTQIYRQIDTKGKAPSPEYHSWYHHHAPFAQEFGDYICIKKDNVNEIATFLKQLFSEEKNDDDSSE